MVITLPSDTLLTIQQAQPSKSSSRGFDGDFFYAKFFYNTRNQSLNLVEVLLNIFQSLGDLCRLHRTHFLIRGGRTAPAITITLYRITVLLKERMTGRGTVLRLSPIRISGSPEGVRRWRESLPTGRRAE